MLSIQLSLPAAIIIVCLGGYWIYQDARKRRMDTADMWAVGFGVGFFLLPIIGGVAVFFYYLHRRNEGGPGQYAVQQQWK